MLHPIPGARQTDELVSVMRGAWSTSPTPPLSYLDYRDLREQNHSLTGLLAYHSDWITLTRAGAAPERIYIGNVSANFFDVLGVKPLLGRFFLPEEETRPDAQPYVVLGYSLWKTRYAGDPQIVGKAIEIARHPVTVIGVAPEGFIGAAPGLRDDAWLTLNPLGTNEYRLTHRSIDFLIVLGRLRPGMSREQATKDLETIMRRIVAAYPNDHLGTNTITLDPMWRSPFGANGYMAATLPILLAIAGLIGAVGILTNSQILIVGAMVVGPEYNAIMGVALGIDKRAKRPVIRGLLALIAGFSAAMIVTLLLALAIRWSGHTPKLYSLGVRPVSSLIDNPNLFSIIVAVLAGIVGVVSLTEARASALIGVFISVTTIPAAADIALSVGYGSWSEARGSAFQLLLNVTVLIAIGALGLRAQRIIWGAREQAEAPRNAPSLANHLPRQRRSGDG